MKKQDLLKKDLAKNEKRKIKYFIPTEYSSLVNKITLDNLEELKLNCDFILYLDKQVLACGIKDLKTATQYSKQKQYQIFLMIEFIKLNF